MVITVEIPDYLFGVGDKVSVKNEHNDQSINVVVTGSAMRGSWEYDLAKGLTLWIDRLYGANSDELDDGFCMDYVTTILPDSYTDSVPPKRLEPNTGITWTKRFLEARGLRSD